MVFTHRFLILLIFFSVSVIASVGDLQLKERYKDWFVYTALEDGDKVCYIASYAKKKSEHYTTDRKPYIMVSYVDKKADEVIVNSGLQYDKEPVVLNFDKKVSYTLPIIQRGFAWADNTETDQELVLRMKRGLSVVVNTKAATINDTYSLLGFRKAYQRMHDLCHKTK